MEHEGVIDTNHDWNTWNGIQSLGRRLELEDYNIVEIGQNTEESPGYPRKPEKTPMKNNADLKIS